MEPGLLKVEDAAKFLALGRSKTYELIQQGLLPVVRIGRAVRVPAAALGEFVERLRAEQAAEGWH